MQLEQRKALAPEQCLHQRKALGKAIGRAGEEFRLQKAFAELAGRIGVGDDAPSYAHPPKLETGLSVKFTTGILAASVQFLPLALRFHKFALRFLKFSLEYPVFVFRFLALSPQFPAFAVQLQRSNGHVEDRPLAREVADGAGINAPGLRLDSGRQLHGPHLGRAGDRAAGKQRPEDLLESHLGAHFAGDVRGHLPEGRVALDGEEAFGPDAAEAAQAAQVVAQQIDDHQVFAAVFGVVAQPLGQLAVFAGGAAAGRGSFHRTGGDAAHGPAVFQLKKQLRRKGEDAVAWPGVQKGAVLDRLEAAQSGVERRRSG